MLCTFGLRGAFSGVDVLVPDGYYIMYPDEIVLNV